MTKGSGGLATVTYLPGVTPVSPLEPPVTDSAPAAGWGSSGDMQNSAEFEPDQLALAEKTSMRALTRRDLSRWELAELLRAQDLDSEVVEYELSRLERVELVSDVRLAQNVVRIQQERKGLGRSAIIAELRRRHVEQHAIDEAIEGLDDEDEQQRADELAQRRARQLLGLDHETAVRRLTGYLMRKGYSTSVVSRAVDAALPRGGTVHFS